MYVIAVSKFSIVVLVSVEQCLGGLAPDGVLIVSDHISPLS